MLSFRFMPSTTRWDLRNFFRKCTASEISFPARFSGSARSVNRTAPGRVFASAMSRCSCFQMSVCAVSIVQLVRAISCDLSQISRSLSFPTTSSIRS